MNTTCDRCGGHLPATPVHRNWVDGVYVGETVCYQCAYAIYDGRLPSIPTKET